MTESEPEFQYMVDFGGLQPLAYWAKTELAPGVVIDAPGHPLKVVRVTVPAEPLGDATRPGRVGRAEAVRLPV